MRQYFNVIQKYQMEKNWAKKRFQRDSNHQPKLNASFPFQYSSSLLFEPLLRFCVSAD